MLRLTSVYCCPCPSKSYMSLSSNQEDRYNWNTICLHTDCSWVLLLACTAWHWVVLLACTAWHCCAWMERGCGDLKIWTSFQRKDFFLLTNVFFVLFCSKIRSFQLWYHCILTRNLSFCGSNSVGGPFLVAYWFNICAHWYCLTRTLSWSNYVILVLVQHLHFLQNWKPVSFCFEGDYK